MKKMIISVLGPDRPGIIAAVSRIMLEQECNVENVSQTILQSEFSGIFIISATADLSPEYLGGLLNENLESMNLSVIVRPLIPTDSDPVFENSEPFVISTRGPDRKGLVAGITEVIAGYGVNVTNLQAVFKGGNDPNRNIMIYEVDVPRKTDQGAFHKALKNKADELCLNISIQHRKIFEAINRI